MIVELYGETAAGYGRVAHGDNIPVLPIGTTVRYTDGVRQYPGSNPELRVGIVRKIECDMVDYPKVIRVWLCDDRAHEDEKCPLCGGQKVGE